MPLIHRVTGSWTQLLIHWLDTEQLAAPDIRRQLATFAADDAVPIQHWQQCLTQAALLRPQQTHIGLTIGAAIQPSHMGVLGYLVVASSTLGEAMLTYQRYERLFYGVDLAEITSTADAVEIRWREAGVGTLADEVAIAALVTFVKRQLAEAGHPLQVGFAHGYAHGSRALEDFFQCPVDLNAPYVYVRFPLTLLTQPLRHADPALRALLDRQAQALLQALPESDEFHRKIQHTLLKHLPDGQISLERLAKDLHQSPRTLQRRLAARGLTWQQLLDRTRRELAQQYLQDPALSLSEIAMLLGYSEQSAFSRAYRRWTQNAPRSMRKK